MTEPLWVLRARELIGLGEIVGTQHEPKVVKFFADSGNAWVRDDETAWCGAFVAAMFVGAGRRDVRPPGEAGNALRAREWLNVGRPVTIPQPGDLAIFERGGKNATTGHVAFFLEDAGDKIKVLGGNQSNKVSIAAYAKNKLLGYRRIDPTAPVAPRPRPTPQENRDEDPAAPTRGPDAPPAAPTSTTAAGAGAGALAVAAAASAGLWWLVGPIVVATILFLTRGLWLPLFRK